MLTAIVFAALITGALGIGIKTAGTGIAEAAAGIRGKPSPSAQRWEAREKARRAEGLPSRKRPTGAFRTVWQNAVEEWVVKQTQKHHGRMEGLRELGPQNSSKAKKKLLRQAEFQARLAAKSAKWFGTGRERLHKVSSELREVIAEKRAEFAGRRAATVDPAVDEDRQQQAAEAVAEIDEAQQSDESTNNASGDNVVPLFPNGTQPDQQTDDSSTNTGGNTDMTASTAQPTQSNDQITVPEITDLATGKQWSDVMGPHFSELAAKFGDDVAILQSNAAGLENMVTEIENGQVALSEFGGEIQASLVSASELVPAAAEGLKSVAETMPNIVEQLQQVSDAIAQLRSALEEQSGLAEEVQTQAANNGVASQTSWYQEG